MTISERLFQIMKEKSISQYRLAQMTGISRKTIYDWNVKKTNPGADKIMVICEALQITPEMLLTGSGRAEEMKNNEPTTKPDYLTEDRLLEAYRNYSDEKKRRLFAYLVMLDNTKES